VVVPYAVDAAAWTALTTEQREQIDRLRIRHPRLIVSTGRLVAYKGYDVLLDAMADLDASLIVIGAGPMRGELLQRGRKLDLRDRLILAGHLDRSEMKVILNAARVFVFPSVSAAESFGIAQLEAMTAALPVVNTALPTAVPHVARHGLEGLTVEPRNSAALAEALRTLLDDRSLVAKLGHAGRQRVHECFDRPMFLERMGSLYQQTIAGR
jgi:rhamnosyl/mannosyltransferase